MRSISVRWCALIAVHTPIAGLRRASHSPQERLVQRLVLSTGRVCSLHVPRPRHRKGPYGWRRRASGPERRPCTWTVHAQDVPVRYGALSQPELAGAALLLEPGRHCAPGLAGARAQAAAPYETVSFSKANVSRIERTNDGFTVTADGGVLNTLTVIVATGVVDELPQIERMRVLWAQRPCLPLLRRMGAPCRSGCEQHSRRKRAPDHALPHAGKGHGRAALSAVSRSPCRVSHQPAASITTPVIVKAVSQ